MATTHAFIVSNNTFQYHIEYMFAGTGRGFWDNNKPQFIDFNNSTESKLHDRTENNICEMIADANRIRKRNFIIFYLQQEKKNEGKFYGIFKACEDYSFLDNSDDKQYLKKTYKES